MHNFAAPGYYGGFMGNTVMDYPEINMVGITFYGAIDITGGSSSHAR
jgi:hypothetical protein